MGFKVFKGVDHQMEFHGLKGRYLTYMGIILGAELLLFFVLYSIGFPLIISVLICVGSFFYLSVWVSGLNKKLGMDGMLKRQAFKRLPASIRMYDRSFVKELRSSENSLNKH